MDEFEKNYNRALRFLSFRPRSVKELTNYLDKKKVSKAVQQKIIDKLLEYKFLDDYEFAKMWIRERTKLKPRSLRIIKRELLAKGIDKEQIDELFSNDQKEIPSDFQMAFSLAQKRFKKYQNLSKQEFFEKMGRFLASKGFNYDTIKEVVQKISNPRSE